MNSPITNTRVDAAAVAQIEAALHYRFNDGQILCEALTHSSAARESAEINPYNERLEFLGDAVLGLVIAEKLWQQFPLAEEGWLSRTRAAVVCEQSLAAFALHLRLGDALQLGRTEQLSGGRAKPSILADAFEALIAAIYLDGSLTAVRALLDRLFDELALNDKLKPIDGSVFSSDPKTELQEYTQKVFRVLPEYIIEEASGPSHQPEFAVAVWVNGRKLATARGQSKKKASQCAAALALEQLLNAQEVPV